MNESRWEASRRSARKNVIVIFLVLIGVSAIAAILIVNNRDQLHTAPMRSSLTAGNNGAVQALSVGDSNVAPAVLEKKVAAIEPLPASPESTVAKKKVTALPPPPIPVPSVGSRAEAAVSAARPAASLPSQRPSAKNAEKVKTAAPSSKENLQSLQLPAIVCRVESRKDVVIYLSLELFFEDAESRSAVLLRRDDIKVMVLKALRGKELSEITTGKLTTELHKAINLLFDHSEIVAVKIRDIRIEKAVKE